MGQCDTDNHEWFAAAERRQSYALAGATLAILAASAPLLGGAVGSRGALEDGQSERGPPTPGGLRRVLRASLVRLVRLPD